MKKVWKYIGICLVALIAVLSSCASNSGASTKTLSYYESNIAEFTTTSLSNGIPVIFKKNGTGKIYVVRMVIDGGTPLVPASKSGLEDVTLEMLQYGSEKYSYTDIQQLKYEQSFSISSSAGYDYSTYGFRCIEKYVEGVLDIFADSILHPLFNSDDFDKLMTEYAEGVQRTLSDPSGLLSETMRSVAFKNHPYESNPSVTEQSLSAITLAEVKEHYKTLLNAKRLSIVVVGDFSESEQKKLSALLENAFGSIGEQPFSKPEIPALTVSGKSVHKQLDRAGDSGYAFGYYVCPSRDSADYIPFALASLFIEDELFAQVREKHGAVYSAGNGIVGGKKLFGVLSVYRASKPENLRQYLYEAIDSFPNERGVQERLDQYKNKYITTVFSSAQDTSGVANNIISSLQNYGDPTAYLRRTEQIQAVTATQVFTAYQNYFARTAERAANGMPNPIRWVVVDKSGQYQFD